jgi:hypothetical protein
VDYKHKRCGTANVFCGIKPKADVYFTKVTPTRSSPEFADFIFELPSITQLLITSTWFWTT